MYKQAFFRQPRQARPMRFLHGLVCLIALLVTIPSAAYAVVDIAIGEGQLVRVNGNAATVFVADPEVADVQVPATNAVLVLGRRAGSTTLYVLDLAGTPLVEQRIDVRHNVEALQSVLRQRFPNLRLSLESAPGSLLVSGSVPDPQVAEAVVRTVKPYLVE